MNVLFLSPYFPPNARNFCTALARRGVKVVAIGDAPPPNQLASAETGLSEYVFEPRMGDYEVLRDVVAGLIARHGKLHRLDSNGEHWLEVEGRLRDDFSVPGPGLEEIRSLRSKLHMSNGFAKAGVQYPSTLAASDPSAVRQFAVEQGLPLVFKPDSGSGAVDTFVVESERELEAALARPLSHHLVQPFVVGDIVTFDGLADATGNILFCTSHVYDTGIMQVREGSLDGHYYSLRAIPQELERVGRLVVSAFRIRERFFHVEFFARPDGTYVGLELNIRPPGGFTTDMMSAACELDVYDLWAAMLSGASLKNLNYSRHFHTAHAGRRTGRRYRIDDDRLVRELGHTLFSVRTVPEAFAATMGNVAYLLRSADLDELRRAISLVHAPAIDAFGS
jgi:ATP-grasp domain